MIATPCYDGKVDVWYANSLTKTLILGKEKGININPTWLGYDALIQRSRNDLIDMFLKSEHTHMFWIDADIEWDEKFFFEFVESGHDVIGGTYPKKSDTNEEYVVRMPKNYTVSGKRYYNVDGLGTGFLCISKKAMQDIWNKSEEYVDPRDDERGGKKRMVCEVRIVDGMLRSEDIVMCDRLIETGYPIILDTHCTCNHIGIGKKYVGDFRKWLNKSKQMF